MRNINEDTITQAVIARHAEAPDARLREVMTSLVQHLHAFAREVRLQPAEWSAALEFLAETGRISCEERREFTLLSDVLGLSALVAAMARAGTPGGTEVTGSGSGPAASNGHACYVRGRVRSTSGAPIGGAAIGVRPPGSSGTSAADGSFRVRSVLAEPTAIPHDGPVGRLLAAMGRHPWRPAHLQIEVHAPGHEPLATQLFREGGRYLESDAAFGVRESLVKDWVLHEAGTTPDGGRSEQPFYTLDVDIVLQPARRS